MQTNFLTSANVGNIATNAQNEVRKTINDRWERLGFTAGLNGYLKENMAVLFENEATPSSRSLPQHRTAVRSKP